MTPESLRLARELMRSPGRRAVSFDVFDTIVLRKGTDPNCVFERALVHLPIPDRCRSLGDAFVQNRVVAEMKARKSKAGGEVLTEEIYAHFPQTLFASVEMAPLMMAEAEFKAERDLCIANPEIVALYHEARDLGLKVGFISDTYWTRAQILDLLEHVCPGLAPDFVYVSSAFGRNKAAGLLGHYLADQGLNAADALHMGDNPVNDVHAAKALGIAAVGYPQAPPYLPAILRGEDVCARLMKIHHGGFSTRLEQGLTVLRRLAAASGPVLNIADATGRAVVGPLFAAFQTFIERRLAELKAQPGKTVKIAFIARDGFLPYRVWQESQAGEAAYIEINRRVALVAASSGGNIEPLQAVFKIIPWVDRASIATFLKAEIPSVRAYFDTLDSEFCTGESFSDQIPELFADASVDEVASGVRDRLLAHLRKSIADFDTLTDLVLVDIGYVGSVQRALRMVFDREGLNIALHGVYMGTVDEAFTTLAAGDSWRGLFDDTIIPPFMKRSVMRNATILEQTCSAPVGSVRDWEDGNPVRELDKRPDHQLDACCDIKEGALDFVRLWQRKRASRGCDPFADIDRARPWMAVLYMRLLTLPTPRERQLFGAMYQDPNLGSTQLLPMIHTGISGAAIDTMPFVIAAQMREPPTWPSGSLTNLSRMAGFIYAMMGSGMMSPDLLADEPIAPIAMAVIKDGEGIPVTVDAGWTCFGDIRIRVPIPVQHQDCTVAMPAKDFLTQGILRTVAIQRGETVAQAMRDRYPEPVLRDKIQGLRVRLSERHFIAHGPEAYLLFPVPPGASFIKANGVAILTILITPLFPEPDILPDRKLLPPNTDDQPAARSTVQ